MSVSSTGRLGLGPDVLPVPGETEPDERRERPVVPACAEDDFDAGLIEQPAEGCGNPESAGIEEPARQRGRHFTPALREITGPRPVERRGPATTRTGKDRP